MHVANLIKLGIATAFAFLLAAQTAGAQQATWLPFTRTEVAKILQDAKLQDVKVATLEQLYSSLPESQKTPDTKARFEAETTRLHGLFGAGETVSAITSENNDVTIFVIGKGDRIHTLRMTLPAVNLSPDVSDRVLRALAALFKQAFPQWPNAATWHVESLKQAWDLKRIHAGGDPIVTHHQDGIIAATFGVVPDIIAYIITTQQRCVQGDFQRWIC
jgi:hypothetical protein